MTPLDEVIAKACAAVSEVRLMADVGALAQWEKPAGSEGERAAFGYLAGRMAEAGFRTQTILHDAFVSLPGPSRLKALGRTMTCITHSFGQPSPEDGFSAEVVYCGKGSRTELEAAGAKDRIALIEGLATPWSTVLANAAGAVGQIHITPDDKLHEMCVSPVWGNPAPGDLESLPKSVIVTISRTDGAALKTALKTGPETATIHAEVDTCWRQTPILVADLFPDHLGEQAPFVMFSGHVDTWYHGVMDNGTANATMLEVARHLSEAGAQMRRGVRLCFWSGHSQGRYSSSAWYADHYFDELDARCVAHVNIDSTGGSGAQDLTGAGSDIALRGVAAEVVLARSGQIAKGRKIARAGDESFWGIGIPALFGAISHQPKDLDEAGHILPLGWWWHTSEDTLDKIDPRLLVRDTQVFVHGVLRLLLSDRLPLDYALYARAIGQELAALHVPESAASAMQLAELAENLAADLEAAATMADEVPPEAYNEILRSVSRVLVPLECTRGDRFSHDPALPLPHWPVLDPLRALHGAGPGTDAFRFAEVGAVRASNRIRHALAHARGLVGLCAGSEKDET